MNKLEESIKSLIKNTGPLTFEKFMDLALYHNPLGYYSSGNVSIGRQGDFYTSPHVHSAFGEVISNFITKGLSVINADSPTIIEIGSGGGALARDILDSIEKISPEAYKNLNYIIIDQSTAQIAAARKKLSHHEKNLKFLSSITDIEQPLNAVVISNELFDALPFHRTIVKNGRLMEIYLDCSDGALVETIAEPSNDSLNKYIDNYEMTLVERQQIEICLRAKKLLKDISSILSQGLMLTIDYGFLAHELYSQTRMNGTFKCMKAHSINESPYTDIGEQDITAHVNFSALIETGKDLGLNKVAYTTQGQFLVDWGILDLLERMSKHNDESSAKKIAAIKNLFMPDSMGNKFKVLLQEKNLGEAADNFYPESPLKISFDVV